MATMSTATTATTPTTSVRVGLALSALLGLANIPFLFPIVDWGTSTPPLGILLVNAAIGMVSVVCAAIAWNTGNRRAIRIDAAALIINGLLTVPGFFVDSTALIRVLSGVVVVTTVVAVVLMMRREPAPVTVVD